MMEIAEIKASLTLSEVIRYYGFKADKYNRIHCPFHEDKTPSMQLYWKTHTAYCFSSNCRTNGKSLDVIDFIMHIEKSSKHEAIKKAESLISGEASPAVALTRAAVLTKMFTYFRNAVHNSKPAKEYLESRNLDHSKLEIGYNTGQSHHGRRKDEALIQSCLKAGLLSESKAPSRAGVKPYTIFGKNCICFALRNRVGQIVSLYFRSIVNHKAGRHFYLKDRQGLYPHYPKSDTKKLILTESVIDAASLLQQEAITREYSVLALYGTNGLTEEHSEALSQLKDLEEVIFFLDGDEAGRKAVSKYAPLLQNDRPGLKITHIEPPEGEDVNSLLVAHTPELVDHLLKARQPFTARPEDKAIFFSDEKKNPAASVPESEPGKQSKQPQLKVQTPYHLRYDGQAAVYAVKGGLRPQLDSLRVSLQMMNRETRQDYRAKIDLYEYKQVQAVSQQAGEKLSLRPDQMEKDLAVLTGLLEAYREEQQEQRPQQPYRIQIGESMQKKCIDFLRQPELLKRINERIGRAGIVGEETSRLLLFMIASSYKMPHTLHALIQGSSGSGKTRLLKVISDLMPAEDVKRYTRVTDNSFYNQPEYFFVHQLLCFEDYDGLKEEAQLAVRELQSSEILRTSTSIKDESGKITGGERVVRGPIASLACTTKGEIYEDNISRCFVVAVDESQEQTQRIIRYQNQTAAGILDKREEKDVREFMGNCIRLLKPHEVINPYATRIQLPEEAHKIRRLNELYQSLVKQITLLHQYQRKQDDNGRLITEKEDLKAASETLFESIVLKVDELDGSLRQFFEKLKQYVRTKAGKETTSLSGTDFNRFEIRAATGVSKTQQHVYMNRLVELEYIGQYGFANRGYRYKIAHWDNLSALRARIKDHLELQLQNL